MENKLKSTHTEDQRFIIGLVDGDSKVIEQIYSDYFSTIQSYVLKNSGTVDDAKDLFNDSLKIIYLQGKNDGLILSRSFGAYLKTVCQRRWLNELKRRQKFIPDIEDQIEPVSDENIGEQLMAHEKMLLYRKHFGELPERCRQILELSIEGDNLREIAKKMKLNYGFVRRRIRECIGGLVKAVKSDPIFEELK